jgi:hypothetical protein
MDTNRYEHYLAAMNIIERMSASKLHPNEREILVDSAEGLLLCRSSEDPEPLIDQARNQIDQLIDSDRWLSEMGNKLFEAIESAGPLKTLA